MSDADIDCNDYIQLRAKSDVPLSDRLADREILAEFEKWRSAVTVSTYTWRPRHVMYVMSAAADVTSSTGDFGKDVAREHRDLKEHFGRKPVHSGEGPVPAGSVDRSVAEQVHADLEGLIRKNEKGE